MTTFYYIPHWIIATTEEQAFAQLMQLEGCEFALDREGIIIAPNSTAHVRACLLGIELLKGQWEEPDTV
jgi:hypothetical protein